MNLIRKFRDFVLGPIPDISKFPRNEAFEAKNSITFYLDGFLRPKISVKVGVLDEDAAKAFAELIYKINMGKYEPLLIDSMVEIGRKKVELTHSIEQILVEWGIKVAGDEANAERLDSNKPFVRPRNAFLGKEK